MKVYHFPFKDSPYEIHLKKGLYMFEAWGAAGTANECQMAEYEPKGRGAYVNGVIKLTEPKTFYIYVGGQSQSSNEAFNGNMPSNYTVAGGGATDFRTQKGDYWYDIDSLKSRIMVAAGGGGNDCWGGGDGGTKIHQVRPKQKEVKGDIFLMHIQLENQENLVLVGQEIYKYW